MNNRQNNPFELFDETLDINATDNYDLTVEISDDGLAMTVVDLLRGKHVLLRYYPVNNEKSGLKNGIQEIVSGDDFLRRQFRRVVIITPAFENTLVPSPLFDDTLGRGYFSFNHPVNGDPEVISNLLPFPGASVVFTIDSGYAQIIKDKWPGAVPWHHTKPLLHHALSASRSAEERYVHLHVEKNFITILLIDKRTLRFCNSFRCSAPGDINYFLFNVSDRSGIRNSETVHVSGIIEPYGELHLSLLNFTENITFSSPVMKHSLSYVMNELALHRWLNLFTASSCE